MSNECTDECVGRLCKHWPFSAVQELAYLESVIKATQDILNKDPGSTYHRQMLWKYEVKRADITAKLEDAKTKEMAR